MNDKLESFLLKHVYNQFPNDYIICLHDVTDADANQNDFTITLCMLKNFLHICPDTSFISLNDMLNTAREPKNNSNRYTITFDDGFESVYTQVYPLMKQTGIPFTCYITTDYIDKKGFLSKDQIRNLANDPICTIGSHMVSHRWTRKMSVKEISHEWNESRKILSDISGQKIMHAALPYGSLLACSRKSIMLAVEAGFTSVATTTARPYIKGSPIIPRCTYSKRSETLQLIFKTV